MSNLTYTLSDQGLEVVILNSGEAFCTQSSYSRWTGVDRTTLVKRCGTLETVEILDSSDLETGVKEFIKGVKEFTPLIKTQIETVGC